MLTQESSLPDVLKPAEVASFLRISRAQAYVLLREEIPSFRVGKAGRRVRRDALLKWIKDHEGLQ